MKKLLFGLLGMAVLFSACNKDDLSSLKLKIEGTVYDSKTLATVEGVMVKVTTNGEVDSTTTDANGYYKLESLQTGDYTLTISGDSYLNTTTTVSSEDLTVNDATEEVTVNRTVYLTPLTETLSFTAYKSYGSYSTAAASQTYTVTFSQAGNTPITGTSDENGLVTLTDMPYQSYVYVSFDFEVNGVTYKETESFYTGSSYTTFYIDGYIANGDFGIVSSNILDDNGNNIEDFVVTDNITISFTQPVDTAESDVDINGYYGDFTETWSNNNMTLTLNPADSLAYNSYYELELDLENADNSDYINKDIYFYTEEE